MSVIKRFEEIDSWIMARSLVKDIYHISATSTLNKDYGLRDQIQRAGVSIMSNIAEGFERGNRKEFIYFLRIARGSCAEVKSQLYVLLDIGCINDDTFSRLYDQTTNIGKTITGFINYLVHTNST
ncbi:four helix bundle protein [Anaerosolibacter sp.]|uniref:four helix bundle protein n=1 Tax=Anaerosolibacter sp. TaxID=1872527 RepID=UPI0039F097A8